MEGNICPKKFPKQILPFSDKKKPPPPPRLNNEVMNTDSVIIPEYLLIVEQGD